MERLVAILIAAHMVADFLLQPDRLAQGKRKRRYLLLHGAIHAVAAYVAVQAWSLWQLPVLLLFSHVVIDAIRVRCPDTTATFVVDQAVHGAALVGSAALLRTCGVVDGFSGCWFAVIVGFGGFVATVKGAGYLVGKVVKPLLEKNKLAVDGLEGGGSLIGQLERALIFAFVLVGYLEGIGFLVAAKSILRFKNTEEQKMAEYVLIGTLLSFALAIALASATKWAMRL